MEGEREGGREGERERERERERNLELGWNLEEPCIARKENQHLRMDLSGRFRRVSEQTTESNWAPTFQGGTLQSAARHCVQV